MELRDGIVGDRDVAVGIEMQPWGQMAMRAEMGPRGQYNRGENGSTHRGGAVGIKDGTGVRGNIMTIRDGALGSDGGLGSEMGQ